MKIFILLDDYSGYDSPFYGQHGVSYLIQHGNVNILFDTGQEAEPILHNIDLLKLSPSIITHVFLSHCHYDHTGGLLGILKKIGRKVPLIAHPDIFRPNLIMDPYLREVGVLYSKEEIGQYAYLYLIKSPIELFKNIYSTGEIADRLDFEKIRLKLFTINKDGELKVDNMMDDMSLAIKTDSGLVVISGCSHAGIISIVRHSIKITDIDKVRAVIGGFHLIDADENKINETVKWLDKLKVEEVYTGHCTGLKAEGIMQKHFGNRFHKLHSGMIIKL